MVGPWLQVLSKAEELRLLGKAVSAAEELGLISLVEKLNLSLSTVGREPPPPRVCCSPGTYLKKTCP